MSAPARWRTGDLLVDLGARDIRRDGQVIDVEAKVFDLIALLIEHRERALSKREIGAALWGNRPVTDAALSQLLRKARRALGDDGNAQRAIRTVHARGLQWVAPLAAADIESGDAQPAVVIAPTRTVAEPSRARPRWRLTVVLAVVLLLAVSAIAALRERSRTTANEPLPRIAVLPVVDNTGEAQLAWTPVGLMGLMAGLFGQQPNIEVIAPADVRALIGDEHSVDAQRRALSRAVGATHVVAAALAKVGPVYQLELNLIASDGIERHETLHGSAPAPLAADAVNHVRTWLKRESITPEAAAQAGIRDPFVAEAYARGLDAQLRGDQAGAKKYFEICIDHDPELLWPRLRLAVAQGMTDQIDAGIGNASRVAAAARERGDDVLRVEALRHLASAAYRRGDMDGAASWLDEALAVPAAAGRPLMLIELLVAYGSIEDDRGRLTPSRAHFERALMLARRAGDRRREAGVLANIAGVENSGGHADIAATRLREALEAARESGDAQLESTILGNLGATEYNSGRPLEAAALVAQALRIAHQRSDRQMQALSTILMAWILAPFDRLDEATTAASGVLAAGERESNPYWQAEAHWALAGLAARRMQWPQAFEHFERARALYESGGMLRNAAQVIADAVQIAARAQDATRAKALAERYRALLAGNPQDALLQSRLPVLAAELLHVGGNAVAAADALAAFVDSRGNDRGPAMQAALFDLGRWQLQLGRHAALLAEPAWNAWLRDHPDAIALRIAALAAAGDEVEAESERGRLERMKHSTQLDIEQELLRIP